MNWEYWKRKFFSAHKDWCGRNRGRVRTSSGFVHRPRGIIARAGHSDVLQDGHSHTRMRLQAKGQHRHADEEHGHDCDALRRQDTKQNKLNYLLFWKRNQWTDICVTTRSQGNRLKLGAEYLWKSATVSNFIECKEMRSFRWLIPGIIKILPMNCHAARRYSTTTCPH